MALTVRSLAVISLLAFSALLALEASAADHPTVTLERVWPELSFERATHLTCANDGTGRVFVCEQKGLVWQIDPKAGTRSVYLDITPVTRTNNNEEGLLSIAFHPKFKENGKLYACYSTGKRYHRSDDARADRKDQVRTRVSVFTTKDPAKAPPDRTSEKIVIEGFQPFGNHNGGHVIFGPDGFLYLGLGDGGAAGDPEGNGQRLDRLLAKILRIDVDSKEPYAIPKDNPFVDRKGACPEIFCYGMRNPWRFCFQPKTGELWAGDVGQNRLEMVRKCAKGSNQGWNVMEASRPFARTTPGPDPIVPPVWEYPRSDGASITGGFFYRGKKIPDLVGTYVFGDYVSGNVWGLIDKPGGKPEVWRLVSNSGKAISSFGEDEDGELYLVEHQNANGGIWRLKGREAD